MPLGPLPAGAPVDDADAELDDDPDEDGGDDDEGDDDEQAAIEAANSAAVPVMIRRLIPVVLH